MKAFALPVHRLSPKGLLSALGFAGFGAALLLYPQQTRDRTAASILYCATALVPSLFPFMVLASYGVRSGAGAFLGRMLAPLTRGLFRLPQACGATVLLSFIGGYPAGARGVSLLLEAGTITREQAGRMMCFCVAPGAAFVVTFLGCGALGSLRLGWILFAAVTLSGLGLGLLTGLGKPLPSPRPAPVPPKGPAPLTQSVRDGCSAVAVMCGCILLFAGFMAILQSSGLFQQAALGLASTGLLLPSQAAACLSFLLEVTGGAGDAAALGVGPAFFAFGLGFGGLCVHLQVFAFFPEFPLSKGRFLLFRFLHGLGAAGVCLALERLFPAPPQPVWALAGEPLSSGLTASTAAGGLSLMLMCLAFLVFAGRSLAQGPLRPQEQVCYTKKHKPQERGRAHGVVPQKEKKAPVWRQR